LIGTTLDKYEVLQKVGEGGMATVYRGRHSTLDRDVAIKVLHPHLSSSSRNRMRFAREAKAVERLRHDNILEIFDYSGSEAHDCYIVTEYVDGETLTHLLHRTGRMPSEMVAIVGVQIARALGYAHQQGILHRDLKTDNVMVRVDGAVKLMDFGIARFLDESQVTMTGALVGSPAFMSPEQAQELALDARSDLFSLGTVLFYLVAGHLPFSGSNPSLILKNVIEGNRPHVAELTPAMSASLADVIEQLLATNPDDRYASASDVEQALIDCLAETRVDPDDAAWSIQGFVEAPEAWVRRLDLHLMTVLAEEGRSKLAEGDHLAALRLFNRLLSMDEDNPEVLELVQNLHGSPQPGRSVPLWWVPVALVVLLAGFGLWRWTTAPRGAEPAVALGRSAVSDASTRATAERAAPTSPAGPDEPHEIESPRSLPPQPMVAPARVERPDDDGGDAPAPPRDPPRRVETTAKVAPRPPEPARPPEPDPPSQASPMGSLWVSADQLTAEVYVGGSRIGRTLEAIPLSAGVYDLRIESPFAESHVESGVVIEPDRKRVVDVSLTLKKRRVEFVGWADDCRVWVDGFEGNTLGELEHYWLVERPDRPLDLEVKCPGGKGDSQRWEYLTRDTVFVAPVSKRRGDD